MSAATPGRAPTATRAGAVARRTVIGLGACAAALLLAVLGGMGVVTFAPGGHEGRYAWISMAVFTVLMAAATALSCRRFDGRTVDGRAVALGSAAGFLGATTLAGLYALLAFVMAQPH